MKSSCLNSPYRVLERRTTAIFTASRRFETLFRKNSTRRKNAGGDHFPSLILEKSSNLRLRLGCLIPGSSPGTRGALVVEKLRSFLEREE